jgi:pimeloyl-ACP methyl ester carboxylesterase
VLAAAGGLILFMAIPEPPTSKATAKKLEWQALASMWTDWRVRASVLGYFGHMWELYTLWVLVPLILATKLEGQSLSFAAFGVLGIGALGCIGGGWLAKRWGSARVATLQLSMSGFCCLLAPWLMSAPLLDWVFARMMVDRPLDIQWGKQRLMDFVKADSAAALGTLLDSTTESEVHLLPQIVSQLSQSVYFIAGAKDTVMEPKYVNYLASFHPYFAHCANNVIEIPHCGHLSLVEYPDIVARYLSELLQAQAEVSRPNG